MYCQDRDGRGDCSNICLPSMMGRSCRCEDGSGLDLNGRTCVNGSLVCNKLFTHGEITLQQQPLGKHKIGCCGEVAFV